VAESRALLSSLGLNPDGRYLAFPHRPDPDKGFETAVLAVSRLREWGENFSLLVPTPADELMWPHQRRYARQRREFVSAHGVEKHVEFHPWISGGRMPAYFRGAEWALFLSRLPEAFGLGAIEAVEAGTPVVSTPAGALPGLLPERSGVEFVEFGDHEAVAASIMSGTSRGSVLRGREFVHEFFAWSKIADRWLEILISVTKSESRFFLAAESVQPDSVPWIRQLASGRIWDDYEMCYRT
jgi:glycosyltransferase involved in cell wall biosynthesis